MRSLLARIRRPRGGIYAVNASTAVSDAEVRAWCSAVEKQIRRDVAPAWHRKPVRVVFVDSPSQAPPGSWVMAVLDDADQAGALGYHSEDEAGRVFGRVSAETCRRYGVEPSTTFSHEVLETFGDPDVNLWADTGQGYQVPRELCDAVEGGWYAIDGVLVSDFVFPAWFRPGGRGRFNQLRTISAPFELDRGGYTVRRFPDGSEDQVFGDRADRAYIAAKRSALSRTTRRSAGVRSS